MIPIKARHHQAPRDTVKNPQPLQSFLNTLYAKVIDSNFGWDDYERFIKRDILSGDRGLDLTNLLLDEFRWAIDTGVNLYVFVIGESGSGKSLTTLTLKNTLLKMLQAEGMGERNYVTFDFDQTQRAVSDSPIGSVFHQDEVSRLSGQGAKTIVEQIKNWMEEARQLRPFCFFCSPSLWELPNLHLVLHVKPHEYRRDATDKLTSTVCEIWIPDRRLKEVTFRLCGYCIVPILPDSHQLKIAYFKKKLENMERLKKYGGLKTALGWSEELLTETIETTLDYLLANYDDMQILAITLDDIKDCFIKLQIDTGNNVNTGKLARAVREELKPHISAIEDEIEESELQKISDSLPTLYDVFGKKVTQSAMRGEFRKLGINEKYLQKALDQWASFVARKETELNRGITIDFDSNVSEAEVISKSEWLKSVIAELLEMTTFNEFISYYHNRKKTHIRSWIVTESGLKLSPRDLLTVVDRVYSKVMTEYAKKRELSREDLNIDTMKIVDDEWEFEQVDVVDIPYSYISLMFSDEALDYILNLTPTIDEREEFIDLVNRSWKVVKSLYVDKATVRPLSKELGISTGQISVLHRQAREAYFGHIDEFAFAKSHPEYKWQGGVEQALADFLDHDQKVVVSKKFRYDKYYKPNSSSLSMEEKLLIEDGWTGELVLTEAMSQKIFTYKIRKAS